MGRAISFDLTDKDQIEIISSVISTSLSLFYKSKYRGVIKFGYYSIFLYRASDGHYWYMRSLFEIPISTVLRIEQNISSYLRKWLGIHRSTSNICLYSLICPCPLLIKKLSPILKSKVSGQLLLRDSLDSNVSSANIEVTGGKWSASEEVEDAESRLEFEKCWVIIRITELGLDL